MPNSSQTEPGTARRHEKAREEGQVARGRDLPGAVAILAGLAALTWLSHGAVTRWRMNFAALLQQATRPEAAIGIEQLRTTFATALYWSGPVVGSAWLAGAAMGFQGGVVFAVPSLLRFERLIPGQHLKSIFSAAGLSRTARSIVPVGFIVLLTFQTLHQRWETMMRAAAMPPAMGLSWLGDLMFGLGWKFALVLLAWSGIDYLLQRRNHETSLRMSRQEIKDENKQTVGNPEVRGRIRKLQRQLRRRRMLLDVPKATVVVTNPTEFAVALQYDPATMAAPIVLAKGRLLLAQTIRGIAVWNGIPIVENVSLARGLYRHVEIGEPIPGAFYAAVAEIMAFVFRAQQHRPAARAAAANMRNR